MYTFFWRTLYIYSFKDIPQQTTQNRGLIAVFKNNHPVCILKHKPLFAHAVKELIVLVSLNNMSPVITIIITEPYSMATTLLNTILVGTSCMNDMFVYKLDKVCEQYHIICGRIIEWRISVKLIQEWNVYRGFVNG